MNDKNLGLDPNVSSSDENTDKTESNATIASNGDNGGTPPPEGATNTSTINSSNGKGDLIDNATLDIDRDGQQGIDQDKFPDKKSSAKKSPGRPPKSKRTTLSETSNNIEKMLDEMAKEEYAAEQKKRGDDGRLIDKDEKQIEEANVLSTVYMIARIMGTYDIADILIRLANNFQIGKFGNKTVLNKLHTRVRQSGDAELMKFLIRKSQREINAENLAARVKQVGKHNAPYIADDEENDEDQ